MLSLSRKADYALLALAHLARSEAGDCVSARCLAESYDLSRALLANVLKQLQHAGFINSTRGATGGYVLAQPANRISLAQVLHAIEHKPLNLARCCHEPETAPVPCQNDQPCACDVQGQCPIRDSIRTLNQQLNAILANLTLHDLLERRVHEAIRHTLSSQGDRDPPRLNVLR